MTPPRSKFPTLGSLIIHRPNGDEVWIGYQSWEAEGDIPVLLTNEAMGDEKWFPFASLEEVAPNLWEGRLWTEQGEGLRATIRPTVETDAITSVTMAGMPRVPMPLDAIASIHASSTGVVMPTLWAMSDDEGFVVTLMLNTDAGLYIRYASTWHLLSDDDVVDGLNVTEVEDTAMEMFDQFDRAGQLVHLTAMPTKEEVVQVVPEGASTSEPAPVLSSVRTMDVPTLTSAEDLPAAIAMAEADPELRWWVERRMKALGIEASLPWT